MSSKDNSSSPVPENEAERIVALKRFEILDTPPEEAFDRITRIAAAYLNVPIALISLVDENRQWFKSHHGLDIDEIPREIAFCAHTIMGDQPMVAEDTAGDPRFANNPLVTAEPNIRFYAGAPLITSDGFKLGAICAIDRLPKTLTEQQQGVLTDLAGLVIDAMELRLAGKQASKQIVSKEQASRDQEERLRAIVDTAVDGIITIDEQGLVESFNHAAVMLFGYEANEVVGNNIKMLMPQPYAAEHDGYLANYRNTNKAKIIGIGREVVGQRKDGTTFPMELSVAEVKLGDRRIFTGIVRDITERQQAIHELDIRQKRLDYLLTASPACIYTCKVSSNFAATFVSDKVRTSFGYEPAMFIEDPKFWASHIHPDDVARVLNDLAQYQCGHESYKHEYRFRLGDGSYCWVYDELQYILDDDGQPTEMIGSWRRIDDLKQAEEGLIAAKENAENANRAKSDFLSRMSHELRTPLNAILGFGQLLEMENLGPSEHESVGHIIKAGRHLTDLINEVLDIARIESGRQNLSPEPVQIRHVLEDAWDLMGPLAAKRGIQLKHAIPDECNAHVLADLQRLKQVVLNLMSNAVKYNHDAGTVTLSCTEAREGIIRISVSDTGPGIAVENRERIFEPFERLNADQSDVEGSGVGLALSKALIEAMGGILNLDSEPGVGSTFWIELPLIDEVANQDSASEITHVVTEAGQSKPATLLYIEDNIANLRLIEVALSRRPYIKLIAAMQGKLGIDLALQHKPDLILLDLHLPGLMGDQVLARLKSHPDTQQIPVVIISADATKRQIKKLLAEGAYAYITKPFNIKELLRTVDTLLESRD